MNFDTGVDAYLEMRLREWRNWYINIPNQGWPHESLTAKMMTLGLIVRASTSRLPIADHPLAEQVDFWMKRLNRAFPIYAQAIEDCYFNPHLPYKAIAHARGISVRTLKQRMHDGKVWLSGYLTASAEPDKEERI